VNNPTKSRKKETIYKDYKDPIPKAEHHKNGPTKDNKDSWKPTVSLDSYQVSTTNL